MVVRSSPILSLFSSRYRKSLPEVFLQKGGLKVCSKFTREHPYRSVISIELQSSFIGILLRNGCFPVNLLHIFRAPFSKTPPGGQLLEILKLILKSCNNAKNCRFYNQLRLTLQGLGFLEVK